MRASDLAGLIPVCCSDVLDSMCFTCVHELSIVDARKNGLSVPLEDFGFSMAFRGEVSGRFGMHLQRETARELTSNFLAKEKMKLAEGEVDEVVGEIANMLCGSVVSRVDGEHGFVMTHPTLIGSLPDFGDEDVLVSRLATDSGMITTWFVVEGDTCH